MQEVRQLLYYIYERHFRPKAVTGEQNHFNDDHCQMLPLCTPNETVVWHNVKKSPSYNKNNIVKYRHLKEKDDHLLKVYGPEENKNVYINPHCEFDNSPLQTSGK